MPLQQLNPAPSQLGQSDESFHTSIIIGCNPSIIINNTNISGVYLTTTVNV